MLGRLFEDVAAIADVRHERHDELFADRVDRRVRDLREELVEEVEERPARVRAAGERGVVAHRADGLLAVAGHRLQDEFEVFGRVAEEPLLGREVARDQRRHDLGEEALDGDAVLLDPAAVGAAAGVARLDLGVLQQPVVGQVEVDHRAGLDAAVADDGGGIDVEDAGFGGEDEEVVPRERPARGAEAVAVERGAGGDAVREGDGGRAVPRLHQRRVVLVEAAHVVAHVVFRAPGLRHQHEHRVRRVASCRDEQLEHVVERGRVGLPVPDERQDLLQVVAEERRGEILLAGLERVEVALEGVDLAVVREHAEGVGELPRREGVRRVALVDEREGRDERGVGEVGVELLDLRREEKALVDDRAGRERADVAALQLLLDRAANDVEATLPRVAVRRGRARTARERNEQLADLRQDAARDGADGLGHDRHVTPREHGGPVVPHDALEQRFLADGAEDHREAVFALGRQVRHPLSEEGVGNLHEQARTVAGLGVVAGRAAVHEALQHGEPVRHDVVRGDVVQARDEPDAAGVVFEVAVIHSGLPKILFHDSLLRGCVCKGHAMEAAARGRGRALHFV